jgi:hypothetical protein
MKTKLYKIAGVATLTVAMLSCNKNLEEYNPGGATADATWNTPQGFVTNVNGAYREQRAWYGKEDGLLGSEAGTDLWFNANKASYANQITRYSGLTPSTPIPATLFNLCYRAINVCNAGINRINDAGFTDEAEKNRRLGELRFLRAFYYWHIVEQFGGVSLRTTETVVAELTATRSPVSAFYDLIIGDLNFAKDNLPNTWGVEYSRATKKSALGLLARAYLSRAYYATGTERSNFFTLARNTANEVISRKTEFNVDLWASPADLWNPANNRVGLNAGNPGNKEALYIISNSTNTALDYDANANRLHAWFLTQYSNKMGLAISIPYGFDNQRRLQPTRYLLDLFNEQMDARYNASFQETWIANSTAAGTTAYTWTAANATANGKAASVIGTPVVSGRDLALQITKNVVADKATKPWILVDRNDLFDTDGKIKSTTDFVAMKKFLDLNRTVANSQPGFNDIIVIRLAEMYLISAEAEFQLGNIGAAATQLNVLRARAAVKTPVDYTLPMQANTEAQLTAGGINFILDERARELCGEHLRWFDLKRVLNDNFASYIKAKNPDITDVQNFHRLRPIPLTELNALSNAAEFGQNPSY